MRGSAVGPARASEDDLRTALRHSEAFYRSLVENLPGNILRKDLHGRFTFANSRVCRTLGVTLEELVGKTDFDFYPPDLASKYQADDRRVIASRESSDLVEEHQTPNGKLYVQVLKTPVCDERDEVIGIQCIFWDVTERRMMEEQLHDERELLRALLETCPDAIYFKDLNSRFLRVSRSLAHKVGVDDPDACVGRSDADYFDADHAREAREDEREIVLTGRPIISKLEREPWLDGREGWAITSKVALRDKAGAVVGTLGISRDITELKRVQEELSVARDVAVESARLKAEFLANMSHEIRTPLNAVVGMAGLLLDTRLDPDQQDCANTIRTSADLLLEIVNDILDFSKIEAGKLTIEIIDFELAQVLEETADLLADRAQQKGLELVTWIAPDVPRMLSGDPGRIRQILANLVSNAVKFTESGEVVLGATLVADGPHDVTLRLDVRDTGIGIPLDAQSRLFTAFTQADGSMTRRYGGTGLGLAICKQLSELMGGSMGFESAPGGGSTFWCMLPFRKALSLAAVPAPDRASLEHVRVLVVDDNETNRTILQRQIASWRMRGESTSNGPEALACLYRSVAAGDPYRIVILDMQMPDMDGLAVARAIKGDPKLRQMRVAILTSLAFHPDESDFRRIGISAYLTKPVKQSRLLDCLATILVEREHDADERWPDSSRTTSSTSSAAPAATPKALRILVAEDNRVNQKVALRQLSRLGYSADAVGNGIEAIDALARARYDIVLMDCQMPEMDGYEATRRIRQAEKTAPGAFAHYIVAITANTLDGDRDKCLASGMDEYLSKPIQLDALRAVLERIDARRPADL